MGHSTYGIIGKNPIKLDKIKFFGLAVAFEDDFAIVFLDEDHLLHWSQKLNIDFSIWHNDMRFGGDLVHFLAKEIGFTEYVQITLEDSWLGVFYSEGNQIDEGLINPLLNKLGVEIKDKENEFDQLNLNDYRLSEAFYWEMDTPYVKKDNIIKGRRE